MVNLLVVAVILATFLAPLVRVVPDGDSDPIERRTILQMLDFTFGDTGDVTHLFGQEAAAYGATLIITAAAVRLAVGLLVVAGIGLVLVSCSLLGSSDPRHRTFVNVTAGTLLGAALLLAAGAATLPVDDATAGPASGVWLPIFAAVLVLAAHGPASDLDR